MSKFAIRPLTLVLCATALAVVPDGYSGKL